MYAGPLAIIRLSLSSKPATHFLPDNRIADESSAGYDEWSLASLRSKQVTLFENHMTFFCDIELSALNVEHDVDDVIASKPPVSSLPSYTSLKTQQSKLKRLGNHPRPS
jgi:hypothetical protein